MKTLTTSIRVWLLAVAFSSSLVANGVPSAREHLEMTRDQLVEAVSGLSKKQLAFKESPERWSIAETLEHIAVSEDFLRDMIENQVLQSETAAPAANSEEGDAMILSMVPDRSQKFQAPEPLQPSDRFGSAKKALKSFKKSRAQTLALFNEREDSLRSHSMAHPMGDMSFDGYQWFLFLSTHTERHTKQIEEVKNHPDFPKSR